MTIIQVARQGKKRDASDVCSVLSNGNCSTKNSAAQARVEKLKKNGKGLLLPPFLDKIWP